MPNDYIEGDKNCLWKNMVKCGIKKKKIIPIKFDNGNVGIIKYKKVGNFLTSKKKEQNRRLHIFLYIKISLFKFKIMKDVHKNQVIHVNSFEVI